LLANQTANIQVIAAANPPRDTTTRRSNAIFCSSVSINSDEETPQRLID
jgi:hypothetical protein